MDPDAALDEARRALAAFYATDDPQTASNAALRLATAFGALDDWLSGGGHLPDAWGDLRTGRA